MIPGSEVSTHLFPQSAGLGPPRADQLWHGPWLWACGVIGVWGYSDIITFFLCFSVENVMGLPEATRIVFNSMKLRTCIRCPKACHQSLWRCKTWWVMSEGRVGWWEPDWYGLTPTAFWELLWKWTGPRGLPRICLGESPRQGSGMS